VSGANTSTLTEQLARGFHGLRFEGELESAYRRDQFRDRMRYLRINLAILAAISLVIIQVDHIVMPVIRRLVPDLARTGIMLPLLIIGFAVTFARRADVWYPRYIAVAMAFALAAMSWVTISAWMAGEPRIFGRMLLAMVAVYFVLGLAFRSAIVVNAIGLAAFVTVAVQKDMPSVDLLHYLLTICIANVICVAGAWNLEHARRTAWLEGQRLAETALQDGLTGIHNRRRFDDHLQRAWAQGVRDRRPIALVFGDIDHFKPFNDRYGHQAGDEALKAVAVTLAGFARGVRRCAGADDQSRHRLRGAGGAPQLDGHRAARRPGAVRRQGWRAQPVRGPRAGVRAHADRLLPPQGGEADAG
jgi:hypothetical protein